MMSADLESAGKVDMASLSEQTMMELLLANVKNKEKLQDIHGDYIDILQWQDLNFDEDGHVTCVEWNFSTPISAGSIDLRWIPLYMQTFSISQCEIGGRIDTNLLPQSLVFLNLRRNRIQGTLEIESLSEPFEVVNIGFNQMTGTLNLPKLPDSITHFIADHNFFSGAINLTRIPPKIKEFSLNNNQLKQKTLIIGKLPQSLVSIRLWGNLFGRVVDGQKNSVNSEMCVSRFHNE